MNQSPIGIDIALAGPDLATRRELFDFIVAELAAHEPEDARCIRPVRVALQNQRNDLLAFAGVLDGKLADIACPRRSRVPRARGVRAAPLPHRLARVHSLVLRQPAYSGDHERPIRSIVNA